MSEPAEERPLTLGRYVLHQAIGGGGMARVHLGRARGAAGFSRLVAIKRLHRAHARDPEFSQMLADEARLVSRIRHPNVVPMLDVVPVEGELLLVMEYVHGVSLAKLVELAPERRIPLPIAARIVLDVLHGLAAAHDAKSERGRDLMLVHRDVSPQNVLVGTDGVARLVDFGIAKAEGKLAVTRDGQLKGKLPYMAPEQLRAGDIDRRTDLYGAGIVLWELATGERLFHRSLQEVVQKKFDDFTVKPPSACTADVPPAFDAMVMRALEADPDARFPHAEAMAEALEQSCDVAGAKDVAAFVAERAGPELEGRDALVASLEETSEVYEMAAASPPPRKRTRWPWPAAAIALLAVGAFFLLRPHPDGSTDGATHGATDLATSPPSAPPSPAPPVSVTIAKIDETPAPPPAPVPSSSPPKPSKIHATGHRSQPAASASPDCDPPFAIDARGIRIPRRECLGH